MPVTDSGRATLNLLRRTDKIYLGGGGRLLFAPQHPRHPRVQGLWDGALFLNYPLEPLCTWALLDEEGNEIVLSASGHRWDPAGMCTTWRRAAGKAAIVVEEFKTVLADDRAVLELDIRNPGRRARTLHLVAWTTIRALHNDGSPLFLGAGYAGGSLAWKGRYSPQGRPGLTLRTSFSLSPRACSFEVRASEGAPSAPVWNTTPFAESFRDGQLPSRVHDAPIGDGIVCLALHTVIALRARESRSAAITVRLQEGETTAPRKSRRLTRTAKEEAEASWAQYIKDIPHFSSPDPHFTAAYWYRWYGLRLNTVDAPTGNYRTPFVCEGIGSFRAPISYSAPCHMLENRWLHDPRLARGSLAVFLQNQREDGAFRGYIDPFHYRDEMFYHAHWGLAVRELLLVHPSEAFAAQAYEGLTRYARYLDRERDSELSGMYDIRNHYETGQEYMRRYMGVHPEADRHHWGEVFRLKGVDVTVYLYELKRTLAWLARSLNRGNEAAVWDAQAGRIREAVLASMWDPGEEMFFDVDPITGRRTGVKAAVCFYPYMTDIVSAEHRNGLRLHLSRRTEFRTPYPVPSSAADDPMFSAEPVWKGRRMSCPWNGRVWPMTNSHIAEALGRTAERLQDRALRKDAAEFIGRFIRMMFHEGDPRRPNSYEHYNPVTGQPSAYRGIDDYQHSWVNDLIIRWVCGVRPRETTVVIDPFPFGLREFALRNLRIRGRRVSVRLRNGTLTLEVDGDIAARAPLGNKMVLHI